MTALHDDGGLEVWDLRNRVCYEVKENGLRHLRGLFVDPTGTARLNFMLGTKRPRVGIVRRTIWSLRGGVSQYQGRGLLKNIKKSKTNSKCMFMICLRPCHPLSLNRNPVDFEAVPIPIRFKDALKLAWKLAGHRHLLQARKVPRVGGGDAVVVETPILNEGTALKIRRVWQSISSMGANRPWRSRLRWSARELKEIRIGEKNT